jgi:catechol 2,3-dioxygenase-like lactoylglutathione lyase family enzyme
MEKTRAFYEEVIGLPLVATWSEADERSCTSIVRVIP